MIALFSPAEAAIARMGFAAKTSLIVVLFLVPVGYLGSLQYLSCQAQANAVRLEGKGLTYIGGILKEKRSRSTAVCHRRSSRVTRRRARSSTRFEARWTNASPRCRYWILNWAPTWAVRPR